MGKDKYNFKLLDNEPLEEEEVCQETIDSCVKTAMELFDVYRKADRKKIDKVFAKYRFKLKLGKQKHLEKGD